MIHKIHHVYYWYLPSSNFPSFDVSVLAVASSLVVLPVVVAVMEVVALPELLFKSESSHYRPRGHRTQYAHAAIYLYMHTHGMRAWLLRSTTLFAHWYMKRQPKQTRRKKSTGFQCHLNVQVAAARSIQLSLDSTSSAKGRIEMHNPRLVCQASYRASFNRPSRWFLCSWS